MTAELARRAAACKGWRWMPGMLGHALPAGRWSGRVDDSLQGVHALQGANALPDLDDPATLGCLILDLLPEAWGDPWFSIIADGDGRWRCVGSLDYLGLYGFTSRKAAAVAALESAP